ncbi:ComC/BlpC family peptide pheromone/bacteriocin [Listeria monocytogenes]|nr:ComC/BlpC family peptide pheromone/bacteriocin [Listeria monocytogenes]EAE0903932.1 ComC/BlpC family peptide pheromone/bacteriocin [Listeria monocytogenes]EIN6612517.1 Blp family class II bacteriocin [Listeria monocytogenes]
MEMVVDFEELVQSEQEEVYGGGAIGCVLGTAGSTGLGFLAGVGAGTVTLPIIGTVSGGALGGWSGAAMGAATFCRL